jgi:predicted PurR-regulated permease PerM
MEERRVEERIVYFRPRAILVVLGIILTAVAIIAFLFLAWHIITWILIALFLSLALNPAVEFFQRRGMGRTVSSLIVFLLALVGFAALGALLIPPLVDQIDEFIQAVPGFVADLTAGRGPLGFLQDRYQIVDKVEEAIEDQGAGGILGVTNVGLAVARGVVAFVVGLVTIAFLTVFMLIEGPRLVDRFRDALPEPMKPRWERAALS